MKLLVKLENDLTPEGKAAQLHRPALNFYEIGMQKGDLLVWKDDPSITSPSYPTVRWNMKEKRLLLVHFLPN